MQTRHRFHLFSSYCNRRRPMGVLQKGRLLPSDKPYPEYTGLEYRGAYFSIRPRSFHISLRRYHRLYGYTVRNGSLLWLRRPRVRRLPTIHPSLLHRCIQHLRGCSTWGITRHSLHRVWCWYCRGRQDRFDRYRSRALFHCLHVLCPHLRFHPSMGNRKYTCNCKSELGFYSTSSDSDTGRMLDDAPSYKH